MFEMELLLLVERLDGEGETICLGQKGLGHPPAPREKLRETSENACSFR